MYMIDQEGTGGRRKRELPSFDRHFIQKGSVCGIHVIDDSAYTPAELSAVFEQAEGFPHNTLWAVVQPFTYSATKENLDALAGILATAGKVILTDIYAAGETDRLGITALDLQLKIRSLDGQCYYFSTFDEIENFLLENCTNGDLLITLGAGDVRRIGENLLGF